MTPVNLQFSRRRTLWIALVALVIAAAGIAFSIMQQDSSDAAESGDSAAFVQHDDDYAARLAELRDPNVPDLPFADNPDPTQCGIPTPWGKSDPAWLTGYYEGELVQPVVYLYDSHSRLSIKAEAPHGSQVEIVLFQSNPVTDYYMVKITGPDGKSAGEGWVPEPFLSFEPVAPLGDGA